jgi:hypothetical protein
MRVCGFTSDPSLRRLAGVQGALVLLVVAAVLVASPTASAKRKTPSSGRARTCVRE